MGIYIMLKKMSIGLRFGLGFSLILLSFTTVCILALNLSKTESFSNDNLDSRNSAMKDVYIPIGVAVLSGTLFIVLFAIYIAKSEKKLKERSIRLKEMLKKQTRELQNTQEQLIRKERLAVLGQLAGSLGRELRNPLGAISNSVYYLNMVHADVDDNVKEALDIMSKEINNSVKVVRDSLDFSRTKATEGNEASVKEIVANVLEKHPPPEGVEVVTYFAANLPPIFVDIEQIENQVLGNLVINA